MFNLSIFYFLMLATATISRDNKRDLNNKKQSVAKRAKYQVEIELKDDSSDSSCSNFNRNVDELVDFIERDSTMETFSALDVIQLKTADAEENVSPPDFKEVETIFEEVFIEFNKSLEKEQTIKKETLILEDSSSSVEFVEVGHVNGSKQNKSKDRCINFAKEIITLDDSSSSVEIIQDSNEKSALLTTETTQNSSEGLRMSQGEVNKIHRAYCEQTYERKEELWSKAQMINSPIESNHDQFLQTNSELCNLESINYRQDQTGLTKNVDSRGVQEPIEDLLKSFPMDFDNNNSTQDPQCMLKGYNTEKKICHEQDNETTADELREIQKYLFQDFNDEMNQEHRGSENDIGQSNANNELVCENIDENVRKIRELLDQITDEEMDQQQDSSFYEMEEKAFNDSLEMAEEHFVHDVNKLI